MLSSIHILKGIQKLIKNHAKNGGQIAFQFKA